MKRFILSFALIMSAMFMLSVPVTVNAAEATPFPFDKVCEGDAEDSSVCNTTVDNPISGPEGIILRVVRLLSWFTGAASVIMILLGGLKYITANGDANTISTAKNTILYALIGLVVFAFSQAIVLFVINNI